MQLSIKENSVERIGDAGKETQFSITSNAQAFEILSAGIYTDPIAAVVRELSCNAYDAMVEAGKGSDPFIICLPNKMSPNFSVTDNGIGLSDKDLRGLYSSYFQSTKTGTNKQIGAFGLGSKSPFSYTKAFEVISRFGGEKRTYSIFINEDGVPTMTQLAQVETDECNGIEVKLAIRTEDHDSFAETAKKVLQYFPVRPTIKGQSTFQWPEPSETATITDTYTVDRESSGLVAIQGNVPYHVTAYQVQDLMSKECQSFMDRHRITLRFDIGMLDVAANREEVRYEDRTKQNIADAMRAAFDDYLVQVDNKLSELTKTGSTWEIFTILKNTFGSRTNLGTLVGHNFKFKSKLANQWMNSSSLDVDVDWKYHKIIGYECGNLRAVRTRIMTNCTGNGDRQYLIFPGNHVQVVLQDVTTRGSMRMNTKLSVDRSSGGIKSIIAIVPATDRALAKDGKNATAAQRTAELNKILKQMGNPEIVKLSEWTEDVVQKARSARVAGHTFKTFVVPGHGGRTNAKPTFREVSKPTGGGIFIEIDCHRNVVIKGIKHNISGRDLKYMLRPALNIINVSKGTNYRLADVFGITNKVVKHIAGDTNWMPLAEVYGEALIDQKDIFEYYHRIGVDDTLGLSENITSSGFINMVEDLPVKSAFRTIMEPIIEISRDAVKLAQHADFPVIKTDFNRGLPVFENYFTIDRPVVNESSYFDNKVLSAYGMLKLVRFNYRSETKAAFAYIQLVEAQSNNGYGNVQPQERVINSVVDLRDII